MATTSVQQHEQKTLTTSQISTLQIPAGGKIQSLGLIFLTSAGVPVTEAQIRSEISNIRLAINGKDIVNASPILILDAYEALGVSHVGNNTAVAGVVELNVGRLLMIDPFTRDLFGFGTADVANIQVQVTAGTLSAIASVKANSERQAISQNLGSYCKFINYPQSFNSTGDHTVDTLPRDSDSSYLLTLIDDGASGTITNGEVRFNGQVLREKVDSAMNALFTSNKGYTQPAGYFTHFFADGTIFGKVPMLGVTDLRHITTFSVAPGAGGYNVAILTAINMPGAAR